MGPNYVPGQKKDLYVKNVQRTVLCMGRDGDVIVLFGKDAGTNTDIKADPNGDEDEDRPAAASASAGPSTINNNGVLPPPPASSVPAEDSRSPVTMDSRKGSVGGVTLVPGG